MAPFFVGRAFFGRAGDPYIRNKWFGCPLIETDIADRPGGGSKVVMPQVRNI